MRHHQTLKGHGTVTSQSGEQVPVVHDLRVYRDEIRTGTQVNPHATIPGRMEEFRGTVQPVFFLGESELTLELQDGRKLKFLFTGETSGSIAVNSWIG